MIKFIYSDGGRAASGFKGNVGDCVTRSIAIATQTPYLDVYEQLNELAKSIGDKDSSARTGITKRCLKEVRGWLEENGWVWTPTCKVGSSHRIHLREDELPKGRIIARLSKHYCAIIDGTLHDTYDCSRAGQRMIYGYFIKQ